MNKLTVLLLALSVAVTTAANAGKPIRMLLRYPQNGLRNLRKNGDERLDFKEESMALMDRLIAGFDQAGAKENSETEDTKAAYKEIIEKMATGRRDETESAAAQYQSLDQLSKKGVLYLIRKHLPSNSTDEAGLEEKTADVAVLTTYLEYGAKKVWTYQQRQKSISVAKRLDSAQKEQDRSTTEVTERS